MQSVGARSFSLRPLVPQDKSEVIALAEAVDMGTLSCLDRTTVAADKNNRVIGFLRSVVHGGIHYVNPVVVDPIWQGEGVGRALMVDALQEAGELRFVARGYSIDFYRRLGCEPIEWDLIAPEIASDCDECELLETCNPLPMHMRA